MGHAVWLDVYELEEHIFYRDLSDKPLTDDVLELLLSFRNVLITAHMGFLTRGALAEIARVTIENLTAFERGQPLRDQIGEAARSPSGAVPRLAPRRATGSLA
jgi:D-lactate dehydrogenase